MSKHYDVLIVGAGISGIGMACHLVRQCPGKKLAILERRQAIGGTWDLFRYPGIRSDSDMMSFGYKFRPWTDTRILADGPSIRKYVTETAQEFGVDKQIHYGLKIQSANWSSKQRKWNITALEESTGEVKKFSCNFFISATGYYNYDQGYLPKFEGVEDFKGICIHPQHWPEDLNYKGKRVVIIGSGATAVTLVPAMADEAKHVTMLQRSPSYVYSLPGKDKSAEFMKGLLPDNWIYSLSRERNIRIQRGIYKLSRRFPTQMRSLLLSSVRKQVGKDFDMSHFTPKYMPWDQRLCAVPDGDLFKSLREGKASVVTDDIVRFTEKGILLKSGKELEADIIITATGLQIQMLGGMQVLVDGKDTPVNNQLTYKGVLVQDTPNFAYIFGYTNISWTLKVDLAADYVCRLLNEMEQRKVAVVTPRAPQTERTGDSVLESLESGYVQRGNAELPRQGRSGYWKVEHHLEKDRIMFRQPVSDAALEWTLA